MTASIFTNLFVACVVVSFSFSMWLTWRQIRHVASHRQQVPNAFAAAITLEAHQKAADYTCHKARVNAIEESVSTVLLLALTLGGGLAWLFGTSATFTSGTYLLGLTFIVGLMVATSVVSMPFELYRTFIIEARYGFNKTTWSTYLVDTLKGLLVAAFIGVPLLLVTFWLMEKMGSLWWLYVWLTWTGFSIAMMAIYPTFIAPLFNKFAPLDDMALKARIEALLVKCGFQAKGLFVMDGSKRSSHGNAYFTGFGRNKQIVFFDTLLARLTPAEIEAVLAHELGHFKRKHIAKRMVSTFAVTLIILALMGWVIDKSWFYTGLGLAQAGTPHVAVSLVLFFTVLPVFAFWLTPLASLTSRKHEFEADAYAATETNAVDLVAALVKLYRDNASTLTPDPIHSAVYDSHPPAAIRVAHLNKFASVH